MLKGRDEGVGKIDFVDISSSDYSPKDNASISYDEVSTTKFYPEQNPCIAHDAKVMLNFDRNARMHVRAQISC